MEPGRAEERAILGLGAPRPPNNVIKAISTSLSTEGALPGWIMGETMTSLPWGAIARRQFVRSTAACASSMVFSTRCSR